MIRHKISHLFKNSRGVAPEVAIDVNQGLFFFHGTFKRQAARAVKYDKGFAVAALAKRNLAARCATAAK